MSLLLLEQWCILRGREISQSLQRGWSLKNQIQSNLKFQKESSYPAVFIVQRSEKYHVELIDTDSVSNSQPIAYTIHAIEDAEPQIENCCAGERCCA